MGTEAAPEVARAASSEGQQCRLCHVVASYCRPFTVVSLNVEA